MQFKMGVTCRVGDRTQDGPWSTSGFLYTYDRCHMINTLEAGVMTKSVLLENADTTRDILRNYIVWLILHITSEITITSFPSFHSWWCKQSVCLHNK